MVHGACNRCGCALEACECKARAAEPKREMLSVFVNDRAVVHAWTWAEAQEERKRLQRKFPRAKVVVKSSR